MTAKPVNNLKSILTGFKGAVLFNEPMSRHTSFRIGGPARVMVFPENEAELSLLIARAHSRKVPLFMLGEGTNIIVRDKGISGIVISLSSHLAGDSFRKIAPVKATDKTIHIYAGAGASLSRCLKYAVQRGLSGLEFSAGIPGSLGGAIVMNAGSYGWEMKDLIESVRVADRSGKIADIPSREISYHYRSTHIPGIAVIGAVLRLRREEPEKIRSVIKENLHRKKETQPLGKPNAGSIFKNPNGVKAWELIASAGLRGASAGQAAVSEKHTNFIINKGGANASDVLSLIRRIGNKVETETGITLELEVRIAGA